MPIEEEDINNWEQMRRGDKKALFELYNKLYFHLIRFGLKINADDELVKDCVNQIFLNIWDKHERLPPVQQVKSYFMTSLRRCMLDQLAHTDKMQFAFNQMGAEENWNELSYEEIIINVQVDDEVKEKLSLAIKQLTPRQIELIQLKFFEGLTYDQIAVKTSQTVKTAYNTIYDAIKTLRKLLK